MKMDVLYKLADQTIEKNKNRFKSHEELLKELENAQFTYKSYVDKATHTFKLMNNPDDKYYELEGILIESVIYERNGGPDNYPRHNRFILPLDDPEIKKLIIKAINKSIEINKQRLVNAIKNLEDAE